MKIVMWLIGGVVGWLFRFIAYQILWVRRQLHKNAASNLEQVLAATPHKTPTVRPPASYHENYPS